MANKTEHPSFSSEASWTTSKNDLKHKYYRQDVSTMIDPVTSALLETYSHITIAAQPAHVEAIRQKAWSLRAYPCIGLGLYLAPKLRRLPAYPEILQRLSQGQILADIGCFLGHDLRHLVHDGAPAENLYGFDFVDFWELGFEMFRDRDRFGGRFVRADVLADDGKLEEFEGRLDMVHIAMVLHLWDWDGQVEACKKLVSLITPGSLVVGNQVGNVTAQAKALDSIPLPLWRHNEQSFAKMWQEVGLATGTTWECSSWLRTFAEMAWREEDTAWIEEGACVLEFVVRRVSRV